ncbi:MAG: hypothetical protein V3R68_02125 [Gammaproteobacteria bacterium]
MKRDEIDWSILRGGLITLVICLLISSLLAGGSYYFREGKEIEYRQYKRNFQNISQRYLAIDEEEKKIKQFYSRFVELYDNGFIGNEHRLNWLEVLRESGESIQMPAMSYKIDSQQQYVPEFSIIMGSFQLFNSSMDLELGLLHEGDLIRLFEDLDNNADGIYTVTECTFSLTAKDIQLNPDRANIAAKCTLQWLTIKLANGNELVFL